MGKIPHQLPMEGVADQELKRRETNVKTMQNQQYGLMAILTGAALALTATLGAAPATAAGAAEVPAPDDMTTGPAAELNAADKAELEALIAATDQEAGVFDASVALGAGVDASAVADFATSYEAAGLSVINLDSEIAAEPSAAGLRVAAAAACTGDRGYTGFWGWGWQWALNSCDTNLLMAALAGGGGGIAAVGGVLTAAGVTAPAGAVTAAAGGLVAAGAGIVGICKAASYEKSAVYINAYVSGSVGCWGQ